MDKPLKDYFVGGGESPLPLTTLFSEGDMRVGCVPHVLPHYFPGSSQALPQTPSTISSLLYPQWALPATISLWRWIPGSDGGNFQLPHPICTWATLRLLLHLSTISNAASGTEQELSEYMVVHMLELHANSLPCPATSSPMCTVWKGTGTLSES